MAAAPSMHTNQALTVDGARLLSRPVGHTRATLPINEIDIQIACPLPGKRQ